MARQGIVDKKFSKCNIPVCAACMYGRATRKRWRQKLPHDQSKYDNVKPTRPGELVAIDQLESPTPGFIAQMSGILTNSRFVCATIYVDVAKGYGFVWPQSSTSQEETIKGKEVFEQLAREQWIGIEAYRVDNGIFKGKKFVIDCHKKRQSLTFCGVSAHHQNGHAEQRIRILQELTRTSLAHVAIR